jgi:hypothetical protein
MLRSALACGLLLISLGATALGQFAKDPQQPIALDPEYRKLDALVSFLRARNAEQFSIRSPTGIDEASYVPIGGIEQWVRIRGQDRANDMACSANGQMSSKVRTGSCDRRSASRWLLPGARCKTSTIPVPARCSAPSNWFRKRIPADRKNSA